MIHTSLEENIIPKYSQSINLPKQQPPSVIALTAIRDPACRRLVMSFGSFLPCLGQFPVGAPNVLHVDQRGLGKLHTERLEALQTWGI